MRKQPNKPPWMKRRRREVAHLLKSYSQESEQENCINVSNKRRK